MDKRAAFDFRMYLIALLIVMGALVSFSQVYISMAGKYGVTTTNATSFSNTYNRINEVAGITESATTLSSGADLGDESATTTNYGNVVSMLKTIMGALGLPKAMIIDMSSTLGVPSIWITIATLVVVILVITTFIFMVFQTRG